MHILLITGRLAAGGVETHLAELAKQLTRMGHRICLLSGGGAGASLFRDTGAETVQLPLEKASPLRMVGRYHALLRFLRERRAAGDGFDLIHCHTRAGAVFGCRAAKRLGIPSLVTVHGIYRLSPLTKRLSRYGDRTLAISRDVADWLAARCGVPRERIALTVNGIDPVRFSPQGGKTVLHRITALSRLDPDTAAPALALLAAFPAVKAAFPHATLSFVGGGSRLAAVQRQAELLNRRFGADTVTCTGACTDVPAKLAEAELVVAVSRGALEGACAGKIVLCIGQYGYGGLLTPALYARGEETNFCFRTKGSHRPVPVSPSMLAEQIQAAFALSADLRRDLTQANRAFVLRQYSIRRMAEDVSAAAEQLANQAISVRKEMVVAGYYGYGNLGDELLREAACRSLLAREGGVRLTVLVRCARAAERQAAAWEREAEIRYLGRYRVLAVGRALRRAERLVLGGGGLLQDRSSARSLAYYLWLIQAAKRRGAGVELLANGLGPLLRPRSRVLTAKALQGTAVSLRDSGSVALLAAITREAGLPPVPCTLRQDLSRALPLLPDPTRLPPGLPPGRLAVFSLRSDTDKSGWSAAEKEAKRAEASGERILLFPMQPRDRKMCERFARQVGGSVIEAADATREGLCALLALPRVREVVSARLHLLLLGERFGKKRTPLGEDAKLRDCFIE